MDPGVQLRLDLHRDGEYFESISLLEPSGDVRWTANPSVLRSNDVWVDAQLDGDSVIAHTWSSYRVRLSLATGEVLEAVFTK